MHTEFARFYDAIYCFKDYAAEAARVAALVRSVHPRARTILDVACGTGEHARWLAEHHGFDVDGLDLDPAFVAIARAKHATGRFDQADMSEFALGRQYDAVLCLFSSIGYLVTLDRVRRAFECFRQHMNPAGVALVEPWFQPGVMTHGYVVRNAGMHEGAHVERVSRTEIDGRVSRLHFDYRIEEAGGVRHATEIHELGLFTGEEMRDAFAAAGLTAEYDPTGLTGRGLWIARASPGTRHEAPGTRH